ncbi:MAG: hypothetical protein ACLP19_18035 [Xanthobacteraceae bacterium]
MKIKGVVAKSWDFAFAVVAAAAAALWLPSSVIRDLTTELIAFFTIQSAVILPAMIFTAGILRGEGLTLLEIDRYQAALRRQMYFWTTLLFLDLLATASVILGKAANWTWNITVWHHTGDFGRALVALTVFMTSWAVLRMIPFVAGVMSLLNLNGELAKKAIQARNAEKKAPELSPTTFKPPEGYGKIVNHKNRGRLAP